MKPKRLTYYVYGKPFHMPGTLIYHERDGEWIYECLHCGRQRLPRYILRTLVLVAFDKKLSAGWAW
jgi:hypothetical protein